MIYSLNGQEPLLADDVWIAPSADVIGQVMLGAGASVWFGAVARGDNEPIMIGAGSNIQENVALHTDAGFPLMIGENCTIGHNAIVHGAKLGHHVLVGMGAIVMNGAQIGDNSIIAAGALVPEGKEFPAGSLILGSPAKKRRDLSPDEIKGLRKSAEHYQARARYFAKNLREV